MMRLPPALFVVLYGLMVSPAFAAEPAVMVKPSDPETIRTCFRLASIRYMRAGIEARLNAEDVAAGREPVDLDETEEDGEKPGPDPRALFLGWEKALVADWRARGLGDNEIAAEAETLGKTFKPMMMGEMQGDLYDEKQRCRDLLVVRSVDNQSTFEMTDALDPADFGDMDFRPDSPMIDDDNLVICLGQAEMVRLVVGAASLDTETRFYRLRRQRDAASYDQSLAAAFGILSDQVSKDFDFSVDDDHIDTTEEIDAKFRKAEERRAERRALCASYN